VFRGETYVAIKEGTLVGTIALQWEDATYWGERTPDSGYVHRLCTDAEIARPGLGVELLSWAASTSSQRDREWIRLDTPATNARLRSYYESLGFSFRGETEVTVKGASDKLEPWRCALYERSTQWAIRPRG
jgi:protein-tyrosine phosphatase